MLNTQTCIHTRAHVLHTGTYTSRSTHTYTHVQFKGWTGTCGGDIVNLDLPLEIGRKNELMVMFSCNETIAERKQLQETIQA